ncbi:MAG: 23S rRNA (uracil(1939)-C(5))-methyltransferase RlmD [Clostridiales bacterium]|nr:23S rRNA (uracil(1939)-C(5))-methyltransferase RlmD [Clostridiales bacterium]
MVIEKIKSSLKASLGEKKFKHTIQTSEAAIKLAEIYGCDVQKAEIAGLLHDCARDLDVETQLEMLIDTEYDQSFLEVPKILHGPCGAIIAKKEYGIEDQDILNAIANHTCGRPDMSLLEKTIFIADAIEPDRDFAGVEILRKTAKRDINLAVLMSLEGTRQKIEKEDGIWYEGSESALEYYKEKIKIYPGSRHVVKVINMTHEGRGVARIDDFVVFIDGAITGEIVEILVVHRAKKYAIAEIYKIIETASERVEPFCRVYNSCGGCSLQHLRYDVQLKFKQNYVMDCLQRIGGFKQIKVSQTKGMKFPYHYRNKAQYPVADGKAGFYKRRSHKIVEHRVCAMQVDDVNEIMNFIKPMLPEFIRHIIFRTGTEGIMMILVSRKAKLDLEQLIKDVTDRYGIVKTVVLNINTKETNTVLGEQNIALYGTGKITDRMLGVEYTISPNSFYQINKEQTKYMYTKIGKLVDLTGNEIVFDLYCGIGSIGLYLAKKAKTVVGVESVPEAVEDAKENAKNNKIENIEFVLGKAENVSSELVEKHGKPDVVIVDPPRKGCEPELLKTILKMGPEKIIYVSCNPSTLARDLQILCANGVYKPGKVQPIDMFPFTSHVETVTLLERK